MSSRLLFAISEAEPACTISLSGTIDEDNNLGEITAGIRTSAALISTSAIKRINSCGARDWVNWLGQLDEKGLLYFLVECSPAMIAHVNLVNNFVGRARIINFYAPYYCSVCDAERMILIDAAEAEAKLPFSAPPCRCQKCDQLMELEASYFAFLKRNREKPQPDESILELARANTRSPSLEGSHTATQPLMATQPERTAAGSHFSAVTVTTTPNSDGKRSLLTNSPAVRDLDRFPADGAANGGRASKLLYLILGLLVVAVSLLAVIVFRSF